MKSRILANKTLKFYIFITLGILMVVTLCIYVINNHSKKSNISVDTTNKDIKTQVKDYNNKTDSINGNASNKENSISQLNEVTHSQPKKEEKTQDRPKEFKVFYDNKETTVDGIYVFNKSNNQNGIMISGFDKFVREVIKCDLIYTEDGNKVVLLSNGHKLSFEVGSNLYTSDKNKGQMKYPPEKVDGKVYFQLSYLMSLLKGELMLPLGGYNIRTYADKDVINFVTAAHINDKDIFN